MSKYVDEILKDIKCNPKSWIDYRGNGVQKGCITIKYYGNTCVLSIISIFINDKDIPCSYMDKFRLERCIKWWYRTQSLETISR